MVEVEAIAVLVVVENRALLMKARGRWMFTIVGGEGFGESGRQNG